MSKLADEFPEMKGLRVPTCFTCADSQRLGRSQLSNGLLDTHAPQLSNNHRAPATKARQSLSVLFPGNASLTGADGNCQ